MSVTMARSLIGRAVQVVGAVGGKVACVGRKMGEMQPILFTIGYEHHSEPSSLVDVLMTAGVERLVDVRELPMSRRRGFSKTALRETVESAGITYEHCRDLGNPKPYRDLYRSGDQAAGERLYRAHVRNGSATAVDDLSATLIGAKTCVLCFEGDHRTCHRAVIVDEIAARIPSLQVRHL